MNLVLKINRLNNHDVVASSSPSVLEGFSIESVSVVRNNCNFEFVNLIEIYKDNQIRILNEQGDEIFNGAAENGVNLSKHYHYNSGTGEFIECDVPEHYDD